MEAVTPIANRDSQIASTPAASLGWSRLPAAYAIPATPPSLAEAQQYCASLANSHYENFSVATWFLPRRLRQHFCNVYAYCRISDDLGDEVGDPSASLALLDQWQAELDACYAGTPRHPVFVALALPPGPDHHPLRNIQRRARLLPLLRESRRPSRAPSVRL
jgi:hypothetical protein